MREHTFSTNLKYFCPLKSPLIVAMETKNKVAVLGVFGKTDYNCFATATNKASVFHTLTAFCM